MTRLKFFALIPILAQLIVAAMPPGIALAHLFPIRSEPRVGRTITAAPAKVRIWFNGELEAAFSTVTVYDSAKQQVDKGNCRVTEASVLEVDLLPLQPGTYRVYYRVVEKDKHVTEGDYSFTLKETKP